MNIVPAPNLLPHTRTIDRRKQRAAHAWIATLTAVVLLIAILSAALSIHLRSSEPTDTGHMDRFATDLVDLRASIPPMKKQLAQLESDSRAQQLASNRIHWPSVLNHVESITSELVRIHAFDAMIYPQAEIPYIEFTLQAHTRTLSQAREYLVSLENTGLFDEIKMLNSRKQSNAEDAPVNSTIRTRIQPKPSTLPDIQARSQAESQANQTQTAEVTP